MKKLIAVLCVCAALAATSFDAEAARRFGGGASFGRTAPTFSQKAPTAPNAVPNAAQQPRAAQSQAQTRPNPAAAAQKPSMMRNVLMGLAGALGITALLSMLGINGAGMASFVMGLVLVLIAFLAVRFFLSRRARPAAAGPASAAPSWQQPQQADDSESCMQEASRAPESQPAAPAVGAGVRAGSVMDQFMSGSTETAPAEQGAADITPADFDREGFLQSARDNYIKLQAAWDSGNVMTLSDFTTNDVFTAITHQLRERGNVPYKTEILSIANELLGIAREGDEYVSSVRFIGKLRINGEEEAVDETWVLVKPVEGSGGWLLAGIKQNEAPAANV